MDTYEVVWFEQGMTKDGKVKATVTLKDLGGNEIKDVTLWSDFPDFANIRPGSKVSGVMTTKAGTNNKVWKSLHASKGRAAPAKKPDMVKAVEKKAESIAASQDRKEASIKQTATFRDATLLTVEWRRERQAKGLTTTAEEWQTEWRNVRRWLDAEFDLPF